VYEENQYRSFNLPAQQTHKKSKVGGKLDGMVTKRRYNTANLRPTTYERRQSGLRDGVEALQSFIAQATNTSTTFNGVTGGSNNESMSPSSDYPATAIPVTGNFPEDDFSDVDDSHFHSSPEEYLDACETFEVHLPPNVANNSADEGVTNTVLVNVDPSTSNTVTPHYHAPAEGQSTANGTGTSGSNIFRSPHILMAIELQQLCSDAQIPLRFYEDFLGLYKKYSKMEVDFEKVPSRLRLMNLLKKELPSVQPTFHKIDGNDFDVVPKFDFMAQVLDLLSSEYFWSVDDCCVNVDDTSIHRFQKYEPPPDEGMTEMQSGRWYSETYEKTIGNDAMCYDTNTKEWYQNWLLPVIFYNDKTGVSAMEGSYTLEPLMFTLGVIRRQKREKDNAWRHLGFIPSCSDPVTKSSAEKSLQFTHDCLSVLLSDVARYQIERPCVVLKLFGKEYRLRLVFEVAFVMGDQLSQDTHCCRKKINGGGAGRIHRGCMCSFLKAATRPMKYPCCIRKPRTPSDTAVQEDPTPTPSNAEKKKGKKSPPPPPPPPEGSCCPVNKVVLDRLTDIILEWEDAKRRDLKSTEYKTQYLAPENEKTLKDALERSMKLRSQVARDILEKVFSLYPVQNAWSKISFGANENGIHRATVDDPMHYNSSGLFMYLAEIAFGGLLPKEQEELESYMRQDAASRSSMKNTLPRGKFSPGFTNCTLLTASEKVGLIYSLYFGLGTSRISELYTKAILRQRNKYSNFCLQAETKEEEEEEEEASPEGKTSTASSARASTACPRYHQVGSQYFFKATLTGTKQKMERTPKAVKRMVSDLNRFGLLNAIGPHHADLDDVQVEYLLQAIHDRVTSNPKTTDEGTMFLPSMWETHDDIAVNEIAVILKKNFRSSQPQQMSASVPSHTYTIVQREIQKHWIHKPKVPGTGDTTAILTDVQGFRDVLERALIFHAVVHEYSDKEQTSLSELKARLHPRLEDIFSKIYRGDSSVDVLTCKCHSHFHLVDDIDYFGCPMGFEASKGERNLKAWAKRPSKTARKCGQATFIEQTSLRIEDYLVLQRARCILKEALADLQASNMVTAAPPAGEEIVSWSYKRKVPHLRYHPVSKKVFETSRLGVDKRSSEGIHHTNLLTDAVKRYLNLNHPDADEINIWKEISVKDAAGNPWHHVRAFHRFDSYGPFFDWVHLKGSGEEGDYYIGKVLLLYCVKGSGEHRALVWRSLPPTETLLRQETDISAFWSMEVNRNVGTPFLRSVPTSDIEKCIRVHERWRTKVKNHIPTTATEENTGLNVLFRADEVYNKVDWVNHFMTSDRSKPPPRKKAKRRK